ncbi:pilin [Patescibacteria group bacterium]|nr:pilin [Patescibacteria group bacterium]MBU1672932.1 pilin [Patescibacteria group bacterium]MBU1963350.1 pilin [Patescibacteria group bacterium]
MKRFLLIGLVIGLVMMPNLAFMADPNLDLIPQNDEELGEFDVALGDAPPYQVAARIINWALGLLGIFSLMLIIWGGFIWMNARGNEEEVKKAKKILEGAIIGLVIILASFGISQYVFENLVNITQ